MLFGNPDTSANSRSPLVRVDSECFTADLCDSLQCECGPQRAEAIRLCREEGRGVIIYMRDEGRGIGLYAKLDAYQLQIDEGLDTFQANEALGFPADARNFTTAADMLKDLGITTVRLLTNNPAKIEALVTAGITIEEVLPTGTYVTREDRRYLETKIRGTTHLLELDDGYRLAEGV